MTWRCSDCNKLIASFRKTRCDDCQELVDLDNEMKRIRPMRPTTYSSRPTHQYRKPESVGSVTSEDYGDVIVKTYETSSAMWTPSISCTDTSYTDTSCSSSDTSSCGCD